MVFERIQRRFCRCRSGAGFAQTDRKSTRLNSSHANISYAVFCLKKKKYDAVVVSDTGMPDADHPALTYALRGIIAFEITLRGPSRDLHFGIFGGAVDNPAMALSH